jgi:hypothetical protein
MKGDPFNAPTMIVKNELGIPYILSCHLTVRPNCLQHDIAFEGVLIKRFADFALGGYEPVENSLA